MKYDKALIASNIQYLRNCMGMTQAELAAKINYSDKAVSKWERGDSIPDIFVMKEIAELFGVTLDFFFEEHDRQETARTVEEIAGQKDRKHLTITLLSVAGVWLLATIAFLVVRIVAVIPVMWKLFPSCVPVSMLLLLIFNGIWGKKKYNVYIISALMWTTLCVLILWLTPAVKNIWQIIFAGIPGEIAVILGCRLGAKKEKKNKRR